jgi:peptidyl-prolyl cis-trans isomerase SurA
MKRGVSAALALLAVFATSASAQDQLRIAAIVNDQVVSVKDVTDRLRLVIASSQLSDNPEARRQLTPQVVRSLIDERLYLQEAERVGVRVSEDEIQRGYDQIEQQNRLPKGKLAEILSQAGISPELLRAKIKADLGWTKVVQRRARATTDVGADEVDEQLSQLRALVGQPEFRFAEIFISVDNPELERQSRETVDRLADEIRRGASFASLARQFSQNATAAVGGDLGWVAEGRLPEELATLARRMSPGDLTDPVRLPTGYYIWGLIDKRTGGGVDPLAAKLTLRQVFLPASLTAIGPRQLEDKFKAALGQKAECDDLDRIASQFDGKAVAKSPELVLGSLHPALRDMVAKLPVGATSPIMQTDQGLSAIMVCSREEAGAILPTPDEVRERIVRQRIELASRRYLRDLRRTAYIDIRT